MAFHAENNWFRSAENLISTDFWPANASDGDAPLDTSAGGVRINVGSVPDAPGSPVGTAPAVAGGCAGEGTFTSSFSCDADLARRTEVLLHPLPFVRIHSTVNLTGRVS